MEFEWPWQYSFPPFFTIQPNLETRSKQIKLWCELVLSYCEFKNISSFTLEEISKSELFNNIQLKRSLDIEGSTLVFDELSKSGNLEWNSSKNRCFIFYESIEKTANSIMDWADDTGNIGTVFTFYELQQKQNILKNFPKLNEHILTKCIKYLENKKMVQIFSSQTPDAIGVKFLKKQ